jgi:lysyl-tRNA synthetase class I
MDKYVQVPVSRIRSEELTNYARVHGRSLRSVLDSAITGFLSASGADGYRKEEMAIAARNAKQQRDRKMEIDTAARDAEHNRLSPIDLLQADKNERQILRQLAGISAPRRP